MSRSDILCIAALLLFGSNAAAQSAAAVRTGPTQAVVVQDVGPAGEPVSVVALEADENLLQDPGVARGRSPRQSRAFMGVTFGPLNDVLAAQLDLDPKSCSVVLQVSDGSAAAKAGLKRYDVITVFDGDSGASPDRLRELIAKKNPGDEVKVRVMRRGESKELTVKLDTAETSVSRLGGLAGVATTGEGVAEIMGRDAERAQRDSRQALDEARREIERAAQAARRTEEPMKAEIERALRAADEQLRTLRELERAYAPPGRAYVRLPGEGNLIAVPARPGQPGIPPPVAPSPSAPRSLRSPASPDSVQRLEDRMRALEEKLERILQAMPEPPPRARR